MRGFELVDGKSERFWEGAATPSSSGASFELTAGYD